MVHLVEVQLNVIKNHFLYQLEQKVEVLLKNLMILYVYLMEITNIKVLKRRL